MKWAVSPRMGFRAAIVEGKMEIWRYRYGMGREVIMDRDAFYGNSWKERYPLNSDIDLHQTTCDV